MPKAERDKLSNNCTDIFSLNIIDYYVDRPIILEDISLFKFASLYKLSTSKTVDVSSRCMERIKLRSLNKIMQRRRKPVVIKTPKFQGDGENYYFSLLMLHLPFRDEDSLIKPYRSARESFLQKHDAFNLTDMQFDAYLHDIERSVRLMRATDDELGAAIAPNTHENTTFEDLNVSTNHSFMDAENLHVEDTDLDMNLNDGSACDILHSLQVNLLSPEELHQDIFRLTDEQRTVFTLVKNHFDISCKDPLHIFISGGAETVKSFLIKTMVEWLRLFNASYIGSDPVLVCGPTGMSAKNIGGKTLHSSLKLPVQHGSEPSYKELSSKTLQDLRKQYRSIHTIVIDEIYMVSSQTLLYIHRRLCSIKGNDDYFGGLNVILIGDFLQLKPVRGTFAFRNTVLWSLFDTYLLNTNMRQKDNDGYSEILNRIRIGIVTAKDIAVLSSRVIENSYPNFQGVLRVYPTLKEVKDYNLAQQNNLLNNTIQIEAFHQFSNADIGRDDNISAFIPSDDRDAGGLPNNLVLSINTRVMLILTLQLNMV